MAVEKNVARLSRPRSAGRLRAPARSSARPLRRRRRHRREVIPRARVWMLARGSSTRPRRRLPTTPGEVAGPDVPDPVLVAMLFPRGGQTMSQRDDDGSGGTASNRQVQRLLRARLAIARVVRGIDARPPHGAEKPAAPGNTSRAPLPWPMDHPGGCTSAMGPDHGRNRSAPSLCVKRPRTIASPRRAPSSGSRRGQRGQGTGPPRTPRWDPDVQERGRWAGQQLGRLPRAWSNHAPPSARSAAAKAIRPRPRFIARRLVASDRPRGTTMPDPGLGNRCAARSRMVTARDVSPSWTTVMRAASINICCSLAEQPRGR